MLESIVLYYYYCYYYYYYYYYYEYYYYYFSVAILAQVGAPLPRGRGLPQLGLAAVAIWPEQLARSRSAVARCGMAHGAASARWCAWLARHGGYRRPFPTAMPRRGVHLAAAALCDAGPSACSIDDSAKFVNALVYYSDPEER